MSEINGYIVSEFGDGDKIFKKKNRRLCFFTIKLIIKIIGTVFGFFYLNSTAFNDLLLSV